MRYWNVLFFDGVMFTVSARNAIVAAKRAIARESVIPPYTFDDIVMISERDDN